MVIGYMGLIIWVLIGSNIIKTNQNKIVYLIKNNLKNSNNNNV